MLMTAAMFWQYILAVHIIAVLVAFGLLFLYPLLGIVGARVDHAGLPAWNELQHRIHMRIEAPALVVVLVAGIYLASDLHAWHEFYVQWGVAAVIVIGGIGGAFISPRERALTAISTTDLAAGRPSTEYATVLRAVTAARYAQALIALVTIVLMSIQA